MDGRTKRTGREHDGNDGVSCGAACRRQESAWRPGWSCKVQIGFSRSGARFQRFQLACLLVAPRPFWFIDTSLIPPDDAGRGLLYALVANRCNQNGIVAIATDEPDFISPMQVLDMGDFQ